MFATNEVGIEFTFGPGHHELLHYLRRHLIVNVLPAVFHRYSQLECIRIVRSVLQETRIANRHFLFLPLPLSGGDQWMLND